METNENAPEGSLAQHILLVVHVEILEVLFVTKLVRDFTVDCECLGVLGYLLEQLLIGQFHCRRFWRYMLNIIMIIIAIVMLRHLNSFLCKTFTMALPSVL